MINSKSIQEARNYLIFKGIISNQQDIANKMNVSKSNISRALNGDEKYLTEKFLIRFNNAFENVFNINWLLTGEGEMLNTINHSNNEASLIDEPIILRVPLVSQYAQAGYLCGYADEAYMASLPTIPYIVDHEAQGHYVAFEVKGDRNERTV